MTEPGKRTHGLPAGQTGLLTAALALACAGTVPPALAANPVVIQGSDINSAGTYRPSTIIKIFPLDEAVSLLVSTYHFTETEAEEVLKEAYAAMDEPAIDILVQGHSFTPPTPITRASTPILCSPLTTISRR
jgi:hypothetical protein